MSIKEEIKFGKILTKQLSSVFPNMKCVHGNHDLRPVKVAKNLGIPADFMRRTEEVYECPKSWEWAYSHEIDGVKYFHGDGYSGAPGALKAAVNNRRSIAMGHVHGFGGVTYQNNGSDVVFGLNVGCLIDVTTPAFKYGESCKNKPSLGCGVVIEGKEGHFIPLW